MHWTLERSKVPTWKLRPETFDDPVFAGEVGEGIVHYFTGNAGTASSKAMEWDAFKVVVRGLCINKYVGVRKVLLQDVEKAELRLRAAERDRPEHPERQTELVEAKEAVATEIERLWCFDHKKYIVKAHAERDKEGTLLAWLATRVVPRY